MTAAAQINSVQDFLSRARESFFTESRGLWVFRGHSDKSFQLVPSVGRASHKFPTREKYESSLFEIFRREAIGYLSTTPVNEWEWLALGQHHGLPTRLLDWTHNPLVALYFCIDSNENLDGELIALYSNRKLPNSVLNSSPLNIKRPKKYYPTTITPRIRAQEGLFVACSELDAPLDQTLPQGWEIQRYSIPASAKEHLRYELFRLGIHESSLFPDLDGLASRLKWQHRITPPFARA